MSVRWPLLALAVSAAGWVIPLVIGSASGSPGSAGAPTWVFVSYGVSGLAFLAFIALLVAWLSLRSRS